MERPKGYLLPNDQTLPVDLVTFQKSRSGVTSSSLLFDHLIRLSGQWVPKILSRSLLEDGPPPPIHVLLWEAALSTVKKHTIQSLCYFNWWHNWYLVSVLMKTYMPVAPMTTLHSSSIFSPTSFVNMRRGSRLSLTSNSAKIQELQGQRSRGLTREVCKVSVLNPPRLNRVWHIASA